MCSDCFRIYYGKRIKDGPPRVPLLFHQATGGRKSTSNFAIFRLPSELHLAIAAYLRPAELRTLSLLDRDCNVLARTLQFCHAILGNRSAKFANYLNLEALSRRRQLSRSNGASNYSDAAQCTDTIGFCIRRLSIRTVYPELEQIIKFGLPNLVHLELVAYHAENSDLINSIAFSPIKHLKITKFTIDCAYEPPDEHRLSPNNMPWPALETLEFHALDSPYKRSGLLVLTIAKYSAPTLRSLKWANLEYPRFDLDDEDRPFRMLRDVRFPHLETLALQNVRFATQAFMDVFLQVPPQSISSLKYLLLTTLHDNDGTCDFFSNSAECPLPKIQSFHYHNYFSASLHSFLSVNQLTSFSVMQPISSTLAYQILSNPSLERLTTLKLVFEQPELPPQVLQALSSLTSLTHLWLDVCPGNLGPSWFPSHPELLNQLKPLKSLLCLAFTSDTYVVPNRPAPEGYITNKRGHIVARKHYYNTSMLPPGVRLSPYLTDWDMNHVPLSKRRNVQLLEECLAQHSCDVSKAWERWHIERMEMVAEGYSKTFSRLTWCFVGQLMMRVRKEWKSGKDHVTIVPEIKTRNDEDCLEELWRTWESRII